ncbi:MAG: hypothetical protein ACOCZ8_06300 [Bacteroidota bacterium]
MLLTATSCSTRSEDQTYCNTLSPHFGQLKVDFYSSEIGYHTDYFNISRHSTADTTFFDYSQKDGDSLLKQFSFGFYADSGSIWPRVLLKEVVLDNDFARTGCIRNYNRSFFDFYNFPQYGYTTTATDSLYACYQLPFQVPDAFYAYDKKRKKVFEKQTEVYCVKRHYTNRFHKGYSGIRYCCFSPEPGILRYEEVVSGEPKLSLSLIDF